jgi:hypothetical protein
MDYVGDNLTRNGEFKGLSSLLNRNTNEKLNFAPVRAKFI